MADKTTIVNRALSLLGAEPINNITDDTPEANIASRMYDESRRSLLSECLWNFATKREVLNLVVGSPVWYSNQMGYIFQLPSDIIRIFGTSAPAAIWRVEGDQLISNTNEMGIIYVYDLEDTTKFSSSFTDAFADKLAADMAYAILNSNTETKMLTEKYLGESLPKARSENSQVGTPPEIDDNLWVYSKYGYTPVNRSGINIALGSANYSNLRIRRSFSITLWPDRSSTVLQRLRDRGELPCSPLWADNESAWIGVYRSGKVSG